MTNLQHNESTPSKTRQCSLQCRILHTGQSLSHPNSTTVEETRFGSGDQHVKTNALSSFCLQMQVQGI